MNEVRLIEGRKIVDDRGALSCVNGFDFKGVKRAYMVENHDSHFTRAWHSHKIEGKYVQVVSGAAIVVAVPLKVFDEMGPDANISPRRYILASDVPSVLWIPPGYANGFKNLTADTKIMFYSTCSFDEAKGDDYRWPCTYFGDCFEIKER